MRSGTLVIRGGAIGDFVVTLPVLAQLRAAFPDERIGLLAPLDAGSIAVAGALADELRDVNGRAFSTLLAAAASPDAELSEWISGFERVVTYLHDPDDLLQRRLAALGPVVRRGIHRPVESVGSATGQLMEALAGIAGDDADFDGCCGHNFHLALPCEAHDRAEAELGRAPWVALHPGSGSPRKNWPVACWIEIIREMFLARPQIRLAVFSGEAEGREVPELTRALPRGRCRVFENRPLVEVAALLASCDRFFGHDSGIAHLAAAVGTPAFLLFGPSDPRIWAPPQVNVHILRAPAGDLQKLGIDEVRSWLAGWRI